MDLKEKSNGLGEERINSEQPINYLNKEVLSFREALVLLDISASTLYKKTHQRTIRFFKPSNKRLYFLREDLINYMLSNKQEPMENLEDDMEQYLNTSNHG